MVVQPRFSTWCITENVFNFQTHITGNVLHSLTGQKIPIDFYILELYVNIT